MWKFLKFSSFDPDIQRPIKWRKKIVRQVLESRCKLETLLFKMTVDSVKKKILQRFYTRLNFYNFQEKNILACYDVK